MSDKRQRVGPDCLFVNNSLNQGFKIFMQVLFVVTFLSLFFFLYVVKIEKDIFQHQIDFVVDNLYDEFQTTIDIAVPRQLQKQMKEEILDYLNTVKTSSETYDDIRKQNEDVIDRTKRLVFIFVTVFVACMIAVFLLKFCIDLKLHIVENMIALGAVALTEFLFLNLVTKRYIAANPNHVKLYFAQRIHDYAVEKSFEQ
jgi:hypothetical protein